MNNRTSGCERRMISVIIPVYNGEQYIEKTIKCILQSSYKDIEVIVVIDGSPDHSLEICKNISRTDARVKVYEKENGGICQARNYGIARANGEYICVCDQDDIVRPQMYEKMMERLTTENADMCFCGTGQVVNGQVVPFETFEDATFEGRDIQKQLLLPIIFEGYDIPIAMSKEHRYPSIWKAIIRRSFYEKHHLQFHAYVSFEDDYLMMIDLLSLASKVCTVKYRGYLWNVGLNSESHARKYIADIGSKQQKWVDDVCQSVAYTELSDEEKDYVHQVMNCKMYVDAILNLCSPYRKEKFADITRYYEKNIYCYNFEKSISVAAMAKKSFPMQRYILRPLSKRHTYRSFIVAKWLVFIVDYVYQSKFLMKIDGLMKGK